MDKFTEGPWEARLQGQMPNGVKMFWLKDAEVSIGSTNPFDAILCATAPDMVMILGECADELEAEVRDRWGDDPRLAAKLERDLDTVRRARAIIAKARGQ